MAGLVGIFRPRGLTVDDRGAVERLSRGLDYSGVSRVDTWSDSTLCLARVQHPHQTPTPVLTRPDLDATVLFDGYLLGESRAGAEHASGAAQCLDLYAERGLAGWADLNGQFNIVVSEGRTRSLLLANDRFAARPLYYHVTGDRLVWSTQVRGLLVRDVPRRLSESGMHQLFVFQTILDEETLLEDVRTLPPAGVLTYRDGSARLTRYWAFTYREGAIRPEGHYAEELAEALRGAVGRSLHTASRAGLLLSGGLDSRAILACAPAPLAALTIADSENAEVSIARRLAATRDLPFTFLRRHSEYYTDLVDIGVALGDGAARFDNAHFAKLGEALGTRFDGLVTGYGFDLLLKGSALPKRRRRLRGWPLNRHLLMDLGRTPSPDRLTDVVLATQSDCLWHHPVLRRLFRPKEFVRLEENVRTVLGGILRRAAVHAPDPVRQCEFVRMDMLATRFNAFLNVLSIRHFYRDYAVALDNALLDQHLSLPPQLRLDARVYKRALGLLDPSILSVADANTGLRPGTHYLVEHLHVRVRHAMGRVRRRSSAPPADPSVTEGSWPRMDELIRHRPSLAGRIAAVIQDDASLPVDLFDVPALKGVLADHLEGRIDATWPLLLLLTFGTWFRTTVTTEPI
jgi:asparagine synthase (glutamine-hydrolysing)